MPIPIPTGSYVVMNALTRTYLNVLCFNPVPADIVCSVGNKLGNDIWNVATTQSPELDIVTIQSFGTGAFMSHSSGVVTGKSVHSWILKPNKAVPYAFDIVDSESKRALVVQGNSAGNGARVIAEEETGAASQAWFFIAKVPIPTDHSG